MDAVSYGAGLMAGIKKGSSDAFIDAKFAAILTDANTTQAFKQWWPLTSGDRYARLVRWFSLMASSCEHTYTLRWFKASVSDSSEMTPLDDLAGKSAGALVTEASANTADWTEEDRMMWYVRANAESLSDGTMDVLAVEGVDDTFDVTGELAPVYTFSIAPWVKLWSDENYNYISWRLQPASGYAPYAGDVAPDGSKRVMTWIATFSGGLDADDALTSGAGKAAYNFASAQDGLTAARKRTNKNGGHCDGLLTDCDAQRILHMWQFRHFDLENSGILEGCTSYDVDHTCALAETGVTRVLVTQAHGADYLTGSTVSVTTATARADATSGAALLKRITSKEDVEIEGVTYTALNLETDTAFDTTTSTHVFTMPWHTGSTEALPGHKDGSLYNLVDGKTPARVAGVELLIGAYNIGLDPLYNVSRSGSIDTYKIYECKNSEKQAGSITANYANTGIEKTGIVSGWQYPKEFIQQTGVLFPDIVSGGSTSSRYKSGFSGAASAGVRCPWRWGHLAYAGTAGLACEYGSTAPSNRHWYGVPRLAGSGKKRGEWSAA